MKLLNILLGTAMTFVKAAKHDECMSLQTTFDEILSPGNMFKITASQNMTINKFTIHTLKSGKGNVRVWKYPGDYIDYITSPEANAGIWELIQDINVYGMGAEVPTELKKLNDPAMLDEGDMMSFHIVSDLGLVYSAGAEEGSIVAENDYLKIYSGRGCEGVLTCLESGVVWNGIIDYCPTEEEEGSEDSESSAGSMSEDSNSTMSSEDSMSEGSMSEDTPIDCEFLPSKKKCFGKKSKGMCYWDEEEYMCKPTLQCVSSPDDLDGPLFPICPGMEDYCDGVAEAGCITGVCACDAGLDFCSSGVNPCEPPNDEAVVLSKNKAVDSVFVARMQHKSSGHDMAGKFVNWVSVSVTVSAFAWYLSQS